MFSILSYDTKTNMFDLQTLSIVIIGIVGWYNIATINDKNVKRAGNKVGEKLCSVINTYKNKKNNASFLNNYKHFFCLFYNSIHEGFLKYNTTSTESKPQTTSTEPEPQTTSTEPEPQTTSTEPKPQTTSTEQNTIGKTS